MNDASGLETIEHGADRGQGNLLGIQAYMSAEDYATERGFRARLDAYMEAAARRGWLNARTVVVWPEYIGTWLAVMGEGPAVYEAPTLASAMQRLALANLLRFAHTLPSAYEKDRSAASLFRMQADRMARVYHATFAGLARHYAVTTVAGSIVLPQPDVKDGVVMAGKGPLNNVAAVYAPDGRAHPALVRKVYPISQELPFTTPAPASALPAIETPAGRLGVLICADSWYPDPYERLRSQEIELLAVPSGPQSCSAWKEPWHGYDGAPAPADVDPGDVGVLSEGQAWLRYALARRIGASGARCGVNVFLHGSLWDMPADGGQSTIVCGDTVLATSGAGAALLNLWL